MVPARSRERVSRRVSNRFRPVWAPDNIDIETPSAARMYDYYLGGSHNFAADRALGEEVIRAFPDSRELCQALGTGFRADH